MIKRVEHVLDKYVRPKLAEHYGDVKVLSFQDGVLKILVSAAIVPPQNLQLKE